MTCHHNYACPSDAAEAQREADILGRQGRDRPVSCSDCRRETWRIIGACFRCAPPAYALTLGPDVLDVLDDPVAAMAEAAAWAQRTGDDRYRVVPGKWADA